MSQKRNYRKLIASEEKQKERTGINWIKKKQQVATMNCSISEMKKKEKKTEKEKKEITT